MKNEAVLPWVIFFLIIKRPESYSTGIPQTLLDSINSLILFYFFNFVFLKKRWKYRTWQASQTWYATSVKCFISFLTFQHKILPFVLDCEQPFAWQLYLPHVTWTSTLCLPGSYSLSQRLSLFHSTLKLDINHSTQEHVKWISFLGLRASVN